MVSISTQKVRGQEALKTAHGVQKMLKARKPGDIKVGTASDRVFEGMSVYSEALAGLLSAKRSMDGGFRGFIGRHFTNKKLYKELNKEIKSFKAVLNDLGSLHNKTVKFEKEIKLHSEESNKIPGKIRKAKKELATLKKGNIDEIVKDKKEKVETLREKIRVRQNNPIYPKAWREEKQAALQKMLEELDDLVNNRTDHAKSVRAKEAEIKVLEDKKVYHDLMKADFVKKLKNLF